MHVISPDVLTQAHGLSPLFCSFGIATGLMLWLTGWHWHRFWVVLTVTVVGGLIGLQAGKASGGQVLAMGVLLALAAGILALELARLIVFLGAGFAVWLAAGAIFPSGQELWVAFLAGGLMGVFLYRFWTMVLTSYAGTLLGGHALMCLCEKLFSFHAAGFAAVNSAMLNGIVIAATLLGLAAQSLLERLYSRFNNWRKKRQDDRKKQQIIASVPKPAVPTFWSRLLGKRK